MSKFYLFFLVSLFIHAVMGTVVLYRAGFFDGKDNSSKVGEAQTDNFLQEESLKQKKTLIPVGQSQRKKQAVEPAKKKSVQKEKLQGDIPQSVKKTVPMLASKLTEKTVPEDASKPVEKLVSKDASKPAEKSVPEDVSKPAEKLVSEDASKPTEKLVSEDVSKPAEKTFQQDAQTDNNGEDNNFLTEDMDAIATTTNAEIQKPLQETPKGEQGTEATDLTLRKQDSKLNPVPSHFSPSVVSNARQHINLRQRLGNKKPRYPIEALNKNQQGSVGILYYVNSAGFVEKIQLKHSSGHSVLDNEALRALSQYRYYPGQKGWVSHPVEFSLETKKK